MKRYHVRHWMQVKWKSKKIRAKKIAFPKTSQINFCIWERLDSGSKGH